MEHYLPYLLFLACPISMGAMMFIMMRGNKEPKAGAPDAEVERLKREVEALREAHADHPNEFAERAS